MAAVAPQTNDETPTPIMDSISDEVFSLAVDAEHTSGDKTLAATLARHTENGRLAISIYQQIYGADKTPSGDDLMKLKQISDLNNSLGILPANTAATAKLSDQDKSVVKALLEKPELMATIQAHPLGAKNLIAFAKNNADLAGLLPNSTSVLATMDNQTLTTTLTAFENQKDVDDLSGALKRSKGLITSIATGGDINITEALTHKDDFLTILKNPITRQAVTASSNPQIKSLLGIFDTTDKNANQAQAQTPAAAPTIAAAPAAAPTAPPPEQSFQDKLQAAIWSIALKLIAAIFGGNNELGQMATNISNSLGQQQQVQGRS